MKEGNKKSKKKILLYYLILAACLLVIAAVTVTVVFAVNRNNGGDITIDQPGNNGDDNPGNNPGGNEGDNPGNNPGGNEGDNPGNNPGGNEDDNPTANVKGFVLPVKTANVTSQYDFAYDVTLDRYCVHRGMDFNGATGDNVCAVLDGTIKEIVKDDVLDGSYITLTHSNGITSTYKFIDVNENLKVGNTVKQGDVIGTIAKASGSEMKQGEHLHFEMTVNGKPTDPNTYLDIVEK